MLVLATTGPTVYEVPPEGGRNCCERRVLGKGGPLFDQANVDLGVVNGRVWVSDYQDNKLILTKVAV